MNYLTAQAATRLYEEYKDTEIAFTKEIVKTLRMDPRQVYIKFEGSQWPCIINSTSFTNAKIIIGVSGGAYKALSAKPNAQVNLRYSFYQESGQIISFFVAARVIEIVPYMDNDDLAIIKLQYLQRPAEDLITMIGRLLDANANALRRKEDRILITQTSLRKLNIIKKETIVVVQQVPRHCILQDISFGGAKIILMGLAQFLKDKEVLLNIEFEEPLEKVVIKGTIKATGLIEGRKDLVVANIHFVEPEIPLQYKIRINNYLSMLRKDELTIHSANDNLEVMKEAQPEANANSSTVQELPSQVVENTVSSAVVSENESQAEKVLVESTASN